MVRRLKGSGFGFMVKDDKKKWHQLYAEKNKEKIKKYREDYYLKNKQSIQDYSNAIIKTTQMSFDQFVSTDTKLLIQIARSMQNEE